MAEIPYFTKVVGQPVSAAEAWQRAPHRRATWFPDGPPASGAKGWDSGHAGPDRFAGPPPAHADPAVVLEALAALREQEGWAEVLWMGRLLDVEAASLTAASLRGPQYDPHAPPGPSEAAQRHQALVDAELIRSWSE